MSRVTFDELLEAGSHFGHLTRKWNPAMAPYIFMEQNGIHIIDLHKTVAKLDEACEALKKFAQEGKTVLFVGTKKQAQETISEYAKDAEMPYVVERWPGGMLTNFPTIRKTVSKMANIDKMINGGTFDNLSKREKLQITRQRNKLETNFGSIAQMRTLPQAIFIVDVMKEQIAVREAQRLGIPIFAIVDTNCNPKGIDFVIPANDDASKSIEVIIRACTTAVKEGVQERKIQHADEGEEESDETPARRSRRRQGVTAGVRRRAAQESEANADEDEPELTEEEGRDEE